MSLALQQRRKRRWCGFQTWIPETGPVWCPFWNPTRSKPHRLNPKSPKTMSICCCRGFTNSNCTGCCKECDMVYSQTVQDNIDNNNHVYHQQTHRNHGTTSRDCGYCCSMDSTSSSTSTPSTLCATTVGDNDDDVGVNNAMVRGMQNGTMHQDFGAGGTLWLVPHPHQCSGGIEGLFARQSSRLGGMARALPIEWGRAGRRGRRR